MHIEVITLFPDLLESFFRTGLMEKAAKKELIRWRVVNVRDFGIGKTKRVDDSPYGGGAGMLLMASVMEKAYLASCGGYTVLLSPRGKRLVQAAVKPLLLRAQKKGLTLICGHYEGIDTRFVHKHVDEIISVGDYILRGGEVAAMVLIECLSREISTFMGNPHSLHEESFQGGLLEYDQYTRPQSYKGETVPKILLSGDAKKIHLWRHENRLVRTYARRPDLWKRLSASRERNEVIHRYLRENFLVKKQEAS